MPKSEETIGVFESEIWASGDGPDRFVIARLEDGRTIKGKAAKGELQTGLCYRFLGRHEIHDRFGKQFAFQSFCVTQPAGERAITRYLARAPNIGRRRAQQCYNLYQEDAVRRLREEPDAVAAELPGLSCEMAREAAAWLSAHVRLEGVTLELSGLLMGRGFPRALTKKCIGRWGEMAPSIIKENPYSLLMFSGVGFGLADKLYLELGHPANAIQRQALAAWDALQSDNDGNTWLPQQAAISAIHKGLGGADVDAAGALSFGMERNLIRERVNCSTSYLADARRADSESALAGYIAAAMAEIDNDCGFPDYSRLRWPDVAVLCGVEGRDPTPHQRAELYKATRGVVGVLTGGPGTGKTTTAAALIQALVRTVGSERLAAVSPTGKAAVRLSESLSELGLAIKARTIHSLLGVQSAGEDDGGGWSFKFGEREKLPHRFIFVDEPSMIDTDLMRALFAARRKGCHVLLTGDPHQLPPVGHGAPLRDFIAAGLPSGHLTEIHRNAGRIVRCCKSIREQQRFEAAAELDLEAGENLIVAAASTPEQQVDGVLREVQRAAAAGYDPVWDVQVVVPLNDSGPVCRKVLNEKLQGHLNPKGLRVKGNRFRVGDKIVCGKNGHVPAGPGCPLDEQDDDGKVYVANGEQARVVKVEEGRTIAQLSSPRRVVVIPKSKESDGDKAAGAAKDWDLAYAITTHKAQGSQWRVVIVVADESGGARWVANREWVTTAISRAEKWCVCVGKSSTIQGYCKRTGLWKRKTFLCEKVNELMQEQSQWESATNSG